MTLRKKVVSEYENDETTSYHKLSKKYNVPAPTIQRWIEQFSTPRKRTHWKKFCRPQAQIDKALWLVSLGVPKTVAAKKSNITTKMLHKVLREKPNPYRDG